MSLVTSHVPEWFFPSRYFQDPLRFSSLASVPPGSATARAGPPPVGEPIESPAGRLSGADVRELVALLEPLAGVPSPMTVARLPPAEGTDRIRLLPWSTMRTSVP